MLKSSERAIETLRTTEGDRECEPGSLATQFPQLTGGEPRIVFVASGGVFRGAFHIGMLGALTDCKIKPDLVVGASVGTLMGGALAAMTCSEDGGKAKLARLVMAFLHVDAEVALTQTFKGAARELGLRGRCVPLSPARVRRMILSGSQADPGYAVSGAPAALIDTFSDLFMIPHEGTRKIAADFVAGRVAASVARLLKEIERETLRRLRIEQAVVGTSLLDGLARELLGVESNEASLERQPFLSKGIAFFGTATDLGARTSVLLGGDGILPGAPYNIVEAALASSAFPCVFAPRSLSDIFPGIGSPTRYLADGGMFDNLPFFPAIGILSEVQRDYRASTAGRAETPRGFLRTRFENPDLLIAGALNTLPELEPDGRGEFETMAAIRRRATALQDNVKIRSFEAGSERVRRQVSRYLSNTNDSTRGAEFLDHVVHAAVLPVFPATREHLNGTFAFCRSMKLDRNRLTGSIANGCFETLSALAENQKPSDTLSSVAVRNLTQRGRIPRLAWRAEGAHVPTGMCPWFVRDSLGPRTEESETGLRSFECPFVASARKDAQVRKVYTRCIRDATHRSESRRRGQASVRRVAEEREAASAAPASKSEPDDTGVG
jgi:predicted acylesterase/phospholipase RssA